MRGDTALRICSICALGGGNEACVRGKTGEVVTYGWHRENRTLMMKYWVLVRHGPITGTRC